MSDSRLVKITENIINLALNPTVKEPVRPIREKVELLKRLYAMDQIQDIKDMMCAYSAQAFYCYVSGDEVIASCYILRHDHTRAYSFVRWDYENQTKIWNRKQKGWVTQKKGHHVHPFNLIQIEDMVVSESYQNTEVVANFLKELLVLLSFQSSNWYVYMNANANDLPALKSCSTAFEYDGECLPDYTGDRYWIVQ